jgi:hypothetical protein
MILIPNADTGRAFATVGWFELPTASLAEWIVKTWGGSAQQVPLDLRGLQALVERTDVLTSRLLLPAGAWTAVLTNGPLGTDLGGLPVLIARAFNTKTIRAVASNGATILEVYVGTKERNVYAADDGGRWKFGQFGDPLPFEDVSAYSRHRVKDRFTHDMLHSYLTALDVPPSDEIDLSRATVVSIDNAADYSIT